MAAEQPSADPSSPPVAPTCLEGLTVLEHGGKAAAYGAKLLADFGADVLTSEPAEGDPLRDEWPFLADGGDVGRGALYHYLRTNRRAIRFPLSDPERLRLLSACKVVITDQPDAIREGIGLGTDQLREEFPHLIVVTISPFGATGPSKNVRGGELVTFASGGLAQTSPGLPDGVSDPYLDGPLHPGGYPAAATAGLTAAVATLSALPHDRPHDTAPGDHVDVSEQASVASLVYRYIAVTAYSGIDADRTYPGPLNMPNLFIPCRDGYVVIAAVLDHQWRRLVEALGSPPWAVDPDLDKAAGRNAAREQIEMHLRRWCLQRDGDEIVELAARHGVPCFRFHRLDEMESSAHAQARESLVPVPDGGGARMPAAPFKLGAAPWTLRRPAPATTTPVAQVLREGVWSQPSPVQTSSTPTATRRPLEGVRVLDFGQVLAIPFGTQWMTWLGADVILVESSRHLHTRATPPFSTAAPDPNASAVFNLFNSSKRSLTVDIKTKEGQQILTDLVPHCDVVVENFRAGALDRVGLSYQRLQELRPDIILLALGAFGRSGPMKDAAGLHSAANLYSGLADVTRYPGGSPRIMGACLPDPLAGLNAMLAVLLALQHRQRTGEGQAIDQAMYEALLPFCAGAIMADEGTRNEMRARGTQGLDALFGGYFPAAAAGEWLALEVHDRSGWDRLCATVGFPQTPGADASSGLVAAQMRASIIHWLMTRKLDDAVAELRQEGLGAARASSTSDLLADEQLLAIGFMREIDHPVAGLRRVPTLPWRSGSSESLRFGPAPMLGQHVDDVLAGLLGYSEQRIASLREGGVLA